jgi:twitching motility protein PilT
VFPPPPPPPPAPPPPALACEVLVPNPAIRNLIREDKLHQIYSQMQIGQSKHGMQTFNQSLADLVVRRVIALDDAIARSSDPDELRSLIASAHAGTPMTAAARQRRPE